MASPAVPSPATPLLDEVSSNMTSPNSTSFALSAWNAFSAAGYLTMESKLTITALAIIWIGAHGSLRRPPSAAPLKKTKSGKRRDDEPMAEGLMPSDAIVFPIMAGIMLMGLYYLIQWLQDPAILNKILRVYMSFMGVASLTTLMAHSLRVGSSFLYPGWVSEKGVLWRANEELEVFIKDKGECLPKNSPIPPAFRKFLPARANRFLWDLRHLLTDDWTVRIKVHSLIREKFHLSVNYIFGFFLAFGTVVMYYMTGSPFLSNLMGAGFCYGSFLIMSPTTFATGSLVLMGLFFYDIVMVFYTPYMITVATKLDVPIKLQFQTAAKSSMLGLGDIVVPGIVMCLALRFDLWRHYQRQITYIPTDLESKQQDATSGDVVTVSETRYRTQKATWIDITGCWGDWFWTSSWLGLFKSDESTVVPSIRGSSFRKTYFTASLIGYTLGMIVTLAMLVIFKHGQPALLYLVPGVLGSLWLTALLRGEVSELWMYTEDGSLDTRDVVVELDAEGNVVKEVKKDGEKDDEKKAEKTEEEKKTEKRVTEKQEDDKDAQRKEYSIIAFSITAPIRKPKDQ
ncbi:Intramembrane protease 2 [Colletotrichum sidae]|uniref:Intramembrane protease 2 n=1 Tax=Colletotrichum sidae TaxID=1347389 RepID=A0A4R8THG0_9PEZI|nr:Intramembrane protease 2 [Colletotrichum sidae]